MVIVDLHFIYALPFPMYHLLQDTSLSTITTNWWTYKGQMAECPLMLNTKYGNIHDYRPISVVQNAYGNCLTFIESRNKAIK